MITPVRDFILVEKPQQKDERMAGGLLVRPATVEEKFVRAKVVSTGNGRIAENGNLVPMVVKAGDVIVFNKTHAADIKDSSSGEEFLLLREENVVAIES